MGKYNILVQYSVQLHIVMINFGVKMHNRNTHGRT